MPYSLPENKTLSNHRDSGKAMWSYKNARAERRMKRGAELALKENRDTEETKTAILHIDYFLIVRNARPDARFL